MISLPYLGYLWRSHRVFLSAAFAFVAAFQVLIPLLVDQVDLLGLVRGFVRQMPLPAQQFFGEQLVARLSVGGAIAFGYEHPFVLVTFALVAVVLPSRHLAGAVDNGTMELLLAFPLRRSAVAFTLWLGTGLALLGLTLGCGLGTGLGMLLYPAARDVAAATLLRLGLELWLLMLAVASYTLLLSAFGREGGKAGLRAAGLTLFFYFLDFAAGLWTAVGALAPLGLFHYYEPQRLMTGAAGWANDAVLAAFALACALPAVVHFHRRDLPG